MIERLPITFQDSNEEEPPAAPAPVAPLLKIEEAAALLHISTKHVYTLIRDGSLPCIQLPKRVWRISSADLQAFIDAHRVSGPSDSRNSREDVDAL